MAIIYSRPRIKLPKLFLFRCGKSSTQKYFLKLIIVFLILAFSLSFIIKAVTPVFKRLCIDKAKSVATIITNIETTNTLRDLNYSDFITIHKDEAGNISMIESNITNINYVISDVANRIQTSINNTKDENITISIGSFTGISILSGRGIKVPIRISTIGNVKTEIKSDFIEKGINQTLHRLYLEIECEVSVLTPFNTINETIKNQLIIAENIIIGNIPETYYNIDGISASDAMQTIQ